MLNEQGGVIDDLIVYFLDEDFFRIVVNAAHARQGSGVDRKLAAPFGVELTERADLAMIAVQGPNARAKVARLLPRGRRAKAREARQVRRASKATALFVARTGYTGEDGFEIMLPAARSGRAVARLNARGVEAGGPRRARHAAPRSGHEPVRQGHGREPHAAGKPGWPGRCRSTRAATSSAARRWRSRRPTACKRMMVGLVMDDRGVLRHGQRVVTPASDGEILSGTLLADDGQVHRVRARARGRPARCRSTSAASSCRFAWSNTRSSVTVSLARACEALYVTT